MRESIEGDLLELYHRRKSLQGLARARWLLIKDVFQLFRPAIIGKRLKIESFSFMKNIKWVRLILLSLLVIACILSPFAPGPSNKIVLGLSVGAQTLGYLGLALVPLGLASIYLLESSILHLLICYHHQVFHHHRYRHQAHLHHCFLTSNLLHLPYLVILFH